MMSSCRNLKRWLWIPALLGLLLSAAHAQTNVILHLKNGDRLAGAIISQDTNRVVLATSWVKELPVPLSAIESREPAPAPSPSAPIAGSKAATLLTTNTAAPMKVTAPPVAVSPPSKPVQPPPPKRWKADLQLGTDVLFGAVDRQLYNGRLKFTYELPYKSDPKKFFRTLFDYAVDYGKTDGIKSTDRMDGSIKIDFDLGQRVYVYNLAGAGYDYVRRIDLQYQVGPGVGYHLLTLPKFVLNTEAGLNYQAQYRSIGDDVENIYGRLAENFTWKITERMTFSEKFEFFPNLEESGQFRSRLDATLSFGLWKNLTLNITALDLFDTNPATNVDKNELQIRSTLGILF